MNRIKIVVIFITMLTSIFPNSVIAGGPPPETPTPWTVRIIPVNNPAPGEDWWNYCWAPLQKANNLIVLVNQNQNDLGYAACRLHQKLGGSFLATVSPVRSGDPQWLINKSYRLVTLNTGEMYYINLLNVSDNELPLEATLNWNSKHQAYTIFGRRLLNPNLYANNE